MYFKEEVELILEGSKEKQNIETSILKSINKLYPKQYTNIVSKEDLVQEYYYLSLNKLYNFVDINARNKFYEVKGIQRSLIKGNLVKWIETTAYNSIRTDFKNTHEPFIEYTEDIDIYYKNNIPMETKTKNELKLEALELFQNSLNEIDLKEFKIFANGQFRISKNIGELTNDNINFFNNILNSKIFTNKEREIIYATTTPFNYCLYNNKLKLWNSNKDKIHSKQFWHEYLEISRVVLKKAIDKYNNKVQELSKDYKNKIQEISENINELKNN